ARVDPDLLDAVLSGDLHIEREDESTVLLLQLTLYDVATWNAGGGDLDRRMRSQLCLLHQAGLLLRDRHALYVVHDAPRAFAETAGHGIPQLVVVFGEEDAHRRMGC